MLKEFWLFYEVLLLLGEGWFNGLQVGLKGCFARALLAMTGFIRGYCDLKIVIANEAIY